MLPFEFTIEGPPVSAQARRKERRHRWKADVANAARRSLAAEADIVVDDVALSITYYYDGESPDVDNIIKPIQDALIGIIYNDDTQVVETKSRKKSINGAFRIRGASPLLLGAFSEGKEFLHIKVTIAENVEELD